MGTAASWQWHVAKLKLRCSLSAIREHASGRILALSLGSERSKIGTNTVSWIRRRPTVKSLRLWLVSPTRELDSKETRGYSRTSQYICRMVIACESKPTPCVNLIRSNLRSGTLHAGRDRHSKNFLSYFLRRRLMSRPHWTAGSCSYRRSMQPNGNSSSAWVNYFEERFDVYTADKSESTA